MENPKVEILPGAYVFVHFKVPDQIEGTDAAIKCLDFPQRGFAGGRSAQWTGSAGAGDYFE